MSKSRFFLSVAAVSIGLLLPSFGKKPGKKEEEPSLRIVCVSTIAEDQEVVLATKDEDGKLKEHATTQLRSSSITDKLPAMAGDLHLALKEDKGLKSLCQFTCPAGASRLLVVLRTNAANDAYEAHVVNLNEAGFEKSTMLMVNFSTSAALVQLGADEHKLEAGQQMVAKQTPGESDKYRLQAFRLEPDGKSVLCYDRFFSSNPNTRGMLFLLPDKSRGIKVFTLPIFGDFD
jgi:hypothetical protein